MVHVECRRFQNTISNNNPTYCTNDVAVVEASDHSSPTRQKHPIGHHATILAFMLPTTSSGLFCKPIISNSTMTTSPWFQLLTGVLARPGKGEKRTLRN